MQGTMKQNRFGRIVPVFACFVAMYAALGGSSQGLILCLCSDGHVTVEVQCQPDGCCPVNDSGAAQAGFMSEPASSDPCIDIPLFFAGQEFNVQRAMATPSPLHTLTFGAFTASSAVNPALARIETRILDTSPPLTTHLALDSIVLLI